MRLRYLVIAAILAAVLFVGLIILTNWSLLLDWFVSWTLITFAFYGFDKLQAKGERFRVPEFTLLSMAIVGGCLGAVGGMFVFHHKTTRRKFWIINLISVAAYAVLLLLYFS